MEYCAYCGSPVPAASYAPCPKCGKPANGAPPPVARSGGSNSAIVVVLVVVGVLILVAFLGIVAAIAVPNFLTATQRAKQRRTMADIRSIGTAVEAYITDHRESPVTLDALRPDYIKTVPARDGWGHRFEYACLHDETGKCTGYVIASPAKDGIMEREAKDAVVQPRGPTTNFDCDIVYSNGSFAEYPEGVQH